MHKSILGDLAEEATRRATVVEQERCVEIVLSFRLHNDPLSHDCYPDRLVEAIVAAIEADDD